MSDKEKIENCYQKMYDGMLTKDRNILSEVLDDSFVLVHMTGMQQSKAAFIQAVEDGTLRYYSAEHQQMEVGIQSEQAEMIGRSLVSAAVFGGGRHTWRLQQKLQLIKKADEWKITESRVSTY